MSFFKKTILTLTLTATFSNAVLANETLSKIVSDANDGAETQQVLGRIYDALEAGEVTKNDLMAYLKDNSSPKAYKRISSSIEAGDRMDFRNSLKSQGANFIGEAACSATGLLATSFLTIAGAAFVYTVLFVERPNEYDKDKVTRAQVQIDSHQADLNELLDAGFSEDHYLVRGHREQIARQTIARNEAQSNLDGMNREVEESKKITKLGFVALGATAATILADQTLCN